MLVEPTTYSDLSNPTVSAPLQLALPREPDRADADRRPDPGGSTGWGGRTLDRAEASTTPPPTSPSPSRWTARRCTVRATVRRTSASSPATSWSRRGLSLAGERGAGARRGAAADPRRGQRQRDRRRGERGHGRRERAELDRSRRRGSAAFPKPFPSGALGDQLKEVARIISLNAQFSVGRQVFFCSLDGFDTHAGQANQQSGSAAAGEQGARCVLRGDELPRARRAGDGVHAVRLRPDLDAERHRHRSRVGQSSPGPRGRRQRREDLRPVPADDQLQQLQRLRTTTSRTSAA